MSYLQKYIFQRKNETKTMTKHISCDCKSNFNSTTCNSNENWNNETCQFECKSYCKCKKDYSWNPNTCSCENSRYLKSNTDSSVIACDEIISVMDIASSKITESISRNIMSTASINYHSKKVRDCYILHTVLLVVILLLIITISCYQYAKHTSKLKNILLC